MKCFFKLVHPYNDSMSIFRISGEILAIIIIIYNEETSRSFNFSYKSIEFFVNILDVGYQKIVA
jgi:hypothetical protein